jgi:uncharacterized protein YkwD
MLTYFLRSMLIILACTNILACSKRTVPSSTTKAQPDQSVVVNNNDASKESTPVNPAENNANAPAEINMETMSQDILSYVNQHRQTLGKAPLTLDDAASQQATIHSSNMASKRVPFSHDGFTSRVSAISKKIGAVSAAAENLGYGKLSAKEVVDTWLSSSAHKKNIEGNYDLTGIGFAKAADGTIYYTEIFLRK